VHSITLAIDRAIPMRILVLESFDQKRYSATFSVNNDVHEAAPGKLRKAHLSSRGSLGTVA
jgi:hypothetical protein